MDLGRKGQISIEFILIITIALFYITTVVWPIVESSTEAASDVKGISDTKISAMKIANALNEAESSSGNMKKTISISLPGKAAISCDGSDEIILTAYVATSGGNPDEISCEKGDTEMVDGEEVILNYKCASAISLISGAGTSFDLTGPIFKDLAVEKTSGTVNVGWS